MVGVGIFLLAAVLAFGLLFLRLHTLPERMAHRGHKLQFEIVAVLGLLSMFTGVHAFWVVAQGLRMKPRIFSSHVGCDRTKRNEPRSLLL
jgi:hypothetical protein